MSLGSVSCDMRCSASAAIGAGRSSIVKSAVRAGPWRNLCVRGGRIGGFGRGAQGRTSASHGALRSAAARAESVAQPGASRRPGR